MTAARRLLDDPRLATLFAALSKTGAETRVVGGAVRDALLGLPPHEIDLATTALPDTVLAAARDAGLKGVPTGFEHGTVTIVVAGTPYEVTTLREDVETDGRFAKVRFGGDFEQDAKRRDFTINALSLSPDGKIHDYVGGLADIEARRVRFIGDAATRIREDYLRILRFFRFHAWYGDPEGGLDAEGLAACAAAQDGLDQLSRERVGAEMRKLLAAPDPAPALAAMAASGILARVLPGADPRALAPLVAAEAAAGTAPRWERRLAALGDAPDWETGLRLSRAEIRALAATRRALAEPGPAAAAFRHGAEAARDAALIGASIGGTAPPAALEAELARGGAARLPVRAADLPLRGRALGAALDRIEADWIASDFRLTADELLARL